MVEETEQNNIEAVEVEEEPITISRLTMDQGSLRLLKVRKRQKQKKPVFLQTDHHKKKRLKKTWRRPRGLHNKKRRYILGKGQIVRVGFGSPAAVKGLHPSGFMDVLISRVHDLENMDPGTQAVRISRTVGQRKRIEIIKKAQTQGLKILNSPVEKGDL